MAHYRTLAVCLMVGLSALSAAVQAAQAPKQEAGERFLRAKQFALSSLTERSRILDIERQCVSAATTPAALHACHDRAAGSRETLKRTLKPELERIRTQR